MKIMKALAAIVAASVFAGTALAGPFVLGEVIPSQGLWRPYVGGGWDTGWAIASVSKTIEHGLILDGWYQASVARVWPITRNGNVRLGGAISGFAELCSGAFVSTSVGIGPIVSGRWEGINVFVKFLVFGPFTGEAAMFGLQPVIGAYFDFAPCCETPPPGCEEIYGPDCP